jgi:hypothetical protein
VSGDGIAWSAIEIDRSISNMNSFTSVQLGVNSAGTPDPMAAFDFIRYFTTEGQYKIGKDM